MARAFKRLLASMLIVCVAGTALPVQAGMLPTDAERGRIFGLLDRQDVQAELQARGVNPAEVKARVAAMTDDEVARLAGEIESAPAGGADVLGVILAVFIILLITDILGFTKVFPFTKSVKK